MALVTDQPLGPYEMLFPPGAGGMEDVYRAGDTHDRSGVFNLHEYDVSPNGHRLFTGTLIVESKATRRR